MVTVWMVYAIAVIYRGEREDSVNQSSILSIIVLAIELHE